MYSSLAEDVNEAKAFASADATAGGCPNLATTGATTTVAPAPAPGLTESDKVGLGVGIGIGVPFGIAGLMLWRRQRAAKTHTQPLQQSFLSPTDQDLDGHYSEL